MYTVIVRPMMISLISKSQVEGLTMTIMLILRLPELPKEVIMSSLFKSLIHYRITNLNTLNSLRWEFTTWNIKISNIKEITPMI